MNKVKIFRGVYDPQFIGTSQHATATHILTPTEAPNAAEAIKCLRADIRYFKWRNGVVGHTTVIWSASVEPNCELLHQLVTADQLLDAIDMSEKERGAALPPSILYATAAILEGCSFINGASQNTVSCPGLTDLAQQQLGVYCLGTDFKAGQVSCKPNQQVETSTLSQPVSWRPLTCYADQSQDCYCGIFAYHGSETHGHCQ